jgi:hypothetical protein
MFPEVSYNVEIHVDMMVPACVSNGNKGIGGYPGEAHNIVAILQLVVYLFC